MNALFKNLRVVDLSTVLAGPSVATFFAELGAEVIKIENPKTPDVTRSWRLANESHPTVSAYFSAVNFGKRYVKLDLTADADRSELFVLLENTDVLITNFKYGDDEKFKLTWQELHLRFPRLIVARLMGYTSQPERVAYDVVLQAETGFMHMNGTAESGPVKMPVAMIDVLAAHQLKEGILCALLQRQKTQEGAMVTCTLEQAGLSALVNQATNFLMAEHVPQRMGSLHPNIAPYGETFECADGKYLVLAIGSDKQFAQLCALLDATALASDNRFAHNPDRVKNRTALSEVFAPLFAKETAAYWTHLCIEHHLPAGAIKDMAEVMQTAAAQAMMLKEEIDGKTTARLASVAFKITN